MLPLLLCSLLWLWKAGDAQTTQPALCDGRPGIILFFESDCLLPPSTLLGEDGNHTSAEEAFHTDAVARGARPPDILCDEKTWKYCWKQLPNWLWDLTTFQLLNGARGKLVIKGCFGLGLTRSVFEGGPSSNCVKVREDHKSILRLFVTGAQAKLELS
ncbi:unnamed protein product [Vitrella brassicaformis CCMP3155]|uniref:Uncharacterized protein n=1 Tax=Vitrella brassicaformis (strain CCMP3155) TaxID=1169540 RepID=A0A0G4GZU6_VITBC|nr:unnamed protein product [Vitrella brassicaformis CCMP3155]|mmetsp:Transcript_38341/g.96045  ORF Transcript_38341/g.96045 Transcript_38341/m.96045 type:complete len:158 (-) Transcript_38341:256-729(-)|eukprot:CEM36800.1 unnamed protein product [Vitrella brassicaformis CCMP3155]